MTAYSQMTEAEREASSRSYEENLAVEKREKARKWNEVKEKLRQAMTANSLWVEVVEDEYGAGGYVKGESRVDSPTYLSCSWDRYGSKGRVTISVCTRLGVLFDHAYRYGEERVSISFDGSKTATQMAADIRRRIQPHYMDVDARTKARVAGANDRLNTKRKVLTELKGFAPDDRELSDGKISLDLADGYGDVSYSNETHVSIDLHSIPLAQVMQILKIVREGK